MTQINYTTRYKQLFKLFSTCLINTFPIDIVFPPFVNYRGVSVLHALCRFCEGKFHMFIKEKNGRCPVFRGYTISNKIRFADLYIRKRQMSLCYNSQHKCTWLEIPTKTFYSKQKLISTFS